VFLGKQNFKQTNLAKNTLLNIFFYPSVNFVIVIDEIGVRIKTSSFIFILIDKI